MRPSAQTGVDFRVREEIFSYHLMDSPEPPTLLEKLVDKFNSSRFFTISFVLHVLLVVIFGGTVLFEAMQEPPDFEGGEGGFLTGGEVAPPPPSATQAQPQETTFTVSTPSMQSSTLAAITTTGQNPLSFSMDAIITPSSMIKPNLPAAAASPAKASAAAMSGAVAGQIRDFTGGWGKGSGSGTGTRQREFQFTAFIAQYRGGNWDSVYRVKDGLPRGALPNLLEFMNKASRDKVKTNYKNVQPISLASDKIFATKPPFIFFTGSQNFILSQKEVETLQKYVRLGGAIWGDSSVPGRGSAFDIAFRREMRRVIPDKDKGFEALPMDDPLFTRSPYFKEITKVPSGINYYDDPVYVMRYFNEIAIIYTSNDYGDMWEFGVKQVNRTKWEINNDINEREERVAVSWDLYINNGIYIHNVNPLPPLEGLLNTYKFGTNMVVHLLTRWEDKLRSAPRL